jgi:uncharacterized membrane protein YvbJ
MYCTNCEENNPPDAAFCQKCGKKLDTINQDDATVMTVPPVSSSSLNNGAMNNSQFYTPEPISAPSPSLSQASGEKVIPSTPEFPQATSRPRGRRRYFIGLALLALIVVAIVGANAFGNHSKPNDTLTAYCNALKSRDYQTAYNQLSSGEKSIITEAQFAQFWQQRAGTIKAWTVNSIQEQGSSATATVTFTLSNGSKVPATIILIDESGGWKVASFTVG